MKKRQTIFGVVLLVLGAVLLVCSMTGLISDFFGGFGGGLIAVGIFRLVQGVRYRKDPAYREKYDIDAGDERNLYLRDRAATAAFCMYTVFGGIAVIVLGILGKEELLFFISVTVCVLLVLYLAAYLYYKIKL